MTSVYDSLEFVDVPSSQNYYKNEVDRLIEQELASIMKDKDSKLNSSHLNNKKKEENFFAFKNNPRLRLLYHEKMESQGQDKITNGMDTSRFRLPAPSLSEKANKDNLDAKLTKWKSSVNNAKSQLEHQKNRLENLELMNQFGANSWKLHNYQLESIIKQLDQQLSLLDQEKEDLNQLRYSNQQLFASQLQYLESQRLDLVHRIVQIYLAISKLS